VYAFIYLNKRSPLSTSLFYNELLCKRKQKICWVLVLGESNGKGMERKGGKSVVRRLVKFEIFVQALLQQIAHVAFPVRVVNNNM
jgi:hypothetical protein